jgi:hypothetical protein
VKSIIRSLFVLFAALLMIVPAFAGTQRKTSFSLEQPAMLAGVQLQPGHYTMKWQANESKTPVQILRDGKPVLSTTASVVDQKDPYGSTALCFNTANGRTLSEIYLSKQSLVFTR